MCLRAAACCQQELPYQQLQPLATSVCMHTQQAWRYSLLHVPRSARCKHSALAWTSMSTWLFSARRQYPSAQYLAGRQILAYEVIWLQAAGAVLCIIWGPVTSSVWVGWVWRWRWGWGWCVGRWGGCLHHDDSCTLVHCLPVHALQEVCTCQLSGWFSGSLVPRSAPGLAGALA